MKFGLVGCAVIGTLAILSMAGCDAVRKAEKGSVPSTGAPKKSSGPETAKRPPPPKSIPQKSAGPDAKALVGKNEAELIELLGAPVAVRNEPPAVVWRYRGKVCRLDVFFYFDVGRKIYRSLAYRFYPETRDRRVERHCLSGIRSRRNSARRSE